MSWIPAKMPFLVGLKLVLRYTTKRILPTKVPASHGGGIEETRRYVYISSGLSRILRRLFLLCKNRYWKKGKISRSCSWHGVDPYPAITAILSPLQLSPATCSRIFSSSTKPLFTPSSQPRGNQVDTSPPLTFSSRERKRDKYLIREQVIATRVWLRPIIMFS